LNYLRAGEAGFSHWEYAAAIVETKPPTTGELAMHDSEQADRFGGRVREPLLTVEEDAEIPFKLSRWLVNFRSGPEWYSVGEYVAPSPDRAIERAVEVLGNAAEYRAEEIPWDAAPLSKWTPSNRV
jgi:hypothetical protein